MSVKMPKIMGVVNVTPDSFSDGGRFMDHDRAIEHGLALLSEGADILDIGGESTKPGAEPVSVEEEQRRILPVIETLSARGAFISVDTRHAQTMTVAISAGAKMINDVMALCDDGALDVVIESGVKVCLMHMQGNPQTMQLTPTYDDVVKDVYDFLEQRVEACISAGIDKSNISVDPGIGFGKTLAHNLSLIKNIQIFKDFTGSVLLGTSRKSFIEKVDKGASEDQRLGGSIASVIYGVANGADIVRVHDVAQTRQALEIWQSIDSAD